MRTSLLMGFCLLVLGTLHLLNIKDDMLEALGVDGLLITVIVGFVLALLFSYFLPKFNNWLLLRKMGLTPDDVKRIDSALHKASKKKKKQ